MSASDQLETQPLDSKMRAQSLFAIHRDAVYRRTDRLFAVLLLVQWFAGIVVAIWISPRTWDGPLSRPHPHVWAATLLGGAIICLPVVLALWRPGRTSTRHVVSIGQMLYSALLIHLTGGRIETHFHVFGSLTFLAFYRDWRVLMTGSIVVAADHLLRGFLWPQSVYGVAGGADWRWIEHAGWVGFLDFFLVRACLQGRHEMWAIADRQAQLENAHHEVRRAVAERTAELRESEGRFGAAFEHSAIGLALVGLDGRFLKVNQALCEFLGYEEGELLTRDFQELTFPPDLKEDLRHVQQLLAGEAKAYQLEKRYVRKDGQIVWAHLGVSFIPDASGKPAYFVSQVQDVTARTRAEEALHLRDRAIESFQQGVCITDATETDNPIVYANRGFETLTGYTRQEVVGRNCRFLQGADTDPSDAHQIREAIKSGSPCFVEILNYRKDGTQFWNALSISPIHDDRDRLTHFVAVQTDITRIKLLEVQFRQSQKLESIGRLAGGVAHDFNNLLTVIQGYSEMLLRSMPRGEKPRGLVAEIHKAGERAAGLTRQLLAFSRQQVLEPKVVCLNEVVAEVQLMLSRLIGEDIKLTTNLDPRVGNVRVDPSQIGQVLMNLAVNARDAMPQGGRLTIETGNAILDQSYQREHPKVQPGSYAMIAITDTGCGMDKATLARVFEPFFTTKGVGKGTGLGLAMVHGIVEQSGGHVYLYSEVGRGTTFKIYLPLITEEVAAELLRPATVSPGGMETVLLVEDEGAVRALAGTILRENGYLVLEAANGSDAITVAKAHTGTIDLLLTDVVMPIMGGREVAERLTPVQMGLRVLYMSGYTDDAVVRHGVLQAENAYLQKPFTLDRLLCKVRETLDGNSRSKWGSSAPFQHLS